MTAERKMATVRYHAAEYARLIGLDSAIALDARLPGQCLASKAVRAAAFRIAGVLGIGIPDLVGAFHCMRDGGAKTANHRWRQIPWKQAA